MLRILFSDHSSSSSRPTPPPHHARKPYGIMEKVIDLADLGKIVGELPGGAAVLCLAHDCLVGEEEGDAELEVFVRPEILHSATAALVALRRGVRAQIGGFVTAADESPDGGVQATRLSGVGRGVKTTCPSAGGGVQATCSSGVAGGVGVGTMLLPTIAEMETKAELAVFEDGVCAALSRIFSRSVGGDDDDAAAGGASQTPRVRAALQKHEALLSPQSTCALTALLSARGRQSLAHDNHLYNSPGGSSRNASLSAGNPADWKPVLADALLAVRTISLEHVVMWARACDPAMVEAACNPRKSAVAAEVAPAVGVVEGADSYTESTWAALHEASGLGLSPLMLLTATLCPCDTSRSVGPEDGADRDGQGSVTGGSHDGNASLGDGACPTPNAVRSVLRLLSSNSLDNLFGHISRWQTEVIAKENVEAESDSYYRPVGPKAGAPKILLPNFPGHPAMGEDLSSIDSETLKDEALGVIAALDARGTGALPPGALIAALQCGRAGVRLDSVQAHLVLQLSGGFLSRASFPSDATTFFFCFRWMLPSPLFLSEGLQLGIVPCYGRGLN